MSFQRFRTKLVLFILAIVKWVMFIYLNFIVYMDWQIGKEEPPTIMPRAGPITQLERSGEIIRDRLRIIDDYQVYISLVDNYRFDTPTAFVRGNYQMWPRTISHLIAERDRYYALPFLESKGGPVYHSPSFQRRLGGVQDVSKKGSNFQFFT